MTTLWEFLRESNSIEGYTLVTHKEEDTARDFLALDKITISDVANFVNVTTISHGKMAVIRAVHGLDVYGGGHYPPSGGPEIAIKLNEILSRINNRRHPEDINDQDCKVCNFVLAYDIHCLYEDLHPFTDGNGRSGRLIWLYLMGGQEWLDAAPYNFLQCFYYQSLKYYRNI